MSPSEGPHTRHDERSDAREQAVMLLYEAEQRETSALALMEGRGVIAPDLTGQLLAGVESASSAIDDLIVSQAKGWALDRMPALDRAILRLGVYELRERRDVPVAVAIDEAVELAKRFSTDDSGRFVNGVLAAVARLVRPDEQ